MSLYVMSIVHDSVVDGEGLRTVIFFSGCPHQCPACHNEQSWKLTNGTKMTVDDVYEEVMSNPLTDVTLSGGDPFVQAKEVAQLAKRLKDAGRNIWAYTGYTLEELKEEAKDKQELLRYVDVLVDGRFILERKFPGLLFRGSDNQRIWKLKDGEPIGLIST